MRECGLYIHIPFCQKKCLYCDFPSYCQMDHLIVPYVKAVQQEIILTSSEYSQNKIKSIFIGGGTPTYIHSHFLRQILETVQENYTIEKDAEISMEANPGTFDRKKVLDYYQMGINRISIGLQAWQDSLLKKLGRIHTQKDFIQAFNSAKEVGFENINVDLMFGLPSQSLEDWKETLHRVMDFNPTHLSCYSLKIEEGTPFAHLKEKGRLRIDEDMEREMYYYAKEYLAQCGFNQYEISNFALPGFECKHNLIYWEVEPYIGIGASAHSYMNESRFSNVKSPSQYIQSINQGRIPVVDKHKVHQQERIEEYIFLGLRKTQGISLKDFYHTFHISMDDLYGDTIRDLITKGLIEKKERMYLTPKGLDFANYVFQSFLKK